MLKKKHFINENACEFVVCEMEAILLGEYELNGCSTRLLEPTGVDTVE